MKIALFSGAYKNAGDYLIVERTKQLLKYVLNDCEIETYLRNESLNDYLEQINKCDIGVFAGGPLYLPCIYPNIIPLVPDINNIKIKLFILGGGLHGRDSQNSTIYNTVFTPQTKNFFQRVQNDGFLLGCRDWNAVYALANNGISNAVMTGCPAWYDIDSIGKLSLKIYSNNKIKHILVSDPALQINYQNAAWLVNYLKKKFIDPEITFVFHRGMGNGENKIMLKKAIDSASVKTIDISSSEEGFQVYDKCDLHIGFRVHAHIYNLSKGNISVLIEEDVRGYGVNNALGLTSIRAYAYRKEYQNKNLIKIDNKIKLKRNPYLGKNIDDYLDRLADTNYFEIERSFNTMQMYFEKMKTHIKTMER